MYKVGVYNSEFSGVRFYVKCSIKTFLTKINQRRVK